jgi:hypothetical protein
MNIDDRYIMSRGVKPVMTCFSKIRRLGTGHNVGIGLAELAPHPPPHNNRVYGTTIITESLSTVNTNKTRIT